MNRIVFLTITSILGLVPVFSRAQSFGVPEGSKFQPAGISDRRLREITEGQSGNEKADSAKPKTSRPAPPKKCVTAVVRTWADDTGKHTVEGSFVALEADQVTLQKTDGKNVSLPMARLGKTDQEFASRAKALSDLETTQNKAIAVLKNAIDNQRKLIDQAVTREKNLNAYKEKTHTDKQVKITNQQLAQTKKLRTNALDKISELNGEIAQKYDQNEQDRRRIIFERPMPGDQELIERQGRLVTSDELNKPKKLKAQQAKLQKEQEAFRVDGQRLADWVWKSLAKSYEFKSVSVGVVPIRQGGTRFVEPQAKQVYSLKAGKDKVELLPFGRNAKRDDSFSFQIEYTNGLGQVIRKNGCVEVGYDDSGTACLLGVMAPFLPNPLDGQLIATRSSFDKQLGRAFGVPK